MLLQVSGWTLKVVKEDDNHQYVSVRVKLDPRIITIHEALIEEDWGTHIPPAQPQTSRSPTPTHSEEEDDVISEHSAHSAAARLNEEEEEGEMIED